MTRYPSALATLPVVEASRAAGSDPLADGYTREKVRALLQKLHRPQLRPVRSLLVERDEPDVPARCGDFEEDAIARLRLVDWKAGVGEEGIVACVDDQCRHGDVAQELPAAASLPVIFRVAKAVDR